MDVMSTNGHRRKFCSTKEISTHQGDNDEDMEGSKPAVHSTPKNAPPKAGLLMLLLRLFRRSTSSEMNSRRGMCWHFLFFISWSRALLNRGMHCLDP